MATQRHTSHRDEGCPPSPSGPLVNSPLRNANASDIEPEVLCAVRGIDKTLPSHAPDFHDLAALIERSSETPRLIVRRDGLPPRCSTMAVHEQGRWLHTLDLASNDLTARERSFLDTLADMMARRGVLRLSVAQVDFLYSMISSAWRRGLNP